jgi:GTP cyclohydrolase I
VAIGYIAANHVLGLSKLGRIAEKHAHRLQLQERLVQDIAIEVQELARTDDVAVIASGTHLCMAMRGVRMPHRMVSSAMFGRFRADPAVRAEFMALAAT